MAVWGDVLIGIALVAGSFWTIKLSYMWNIYRRSIQTEIYSNFLEYLMRKKNITKLSESYYFKSRFGKHRIIYQMAQAKNEKTPQAYVIIILTSGIYILSVKSHAGKIIAKKTGDFKQFYKDREKRGQEKVEHQFLLKNPLDEVRFFTKKVKEKVSEINVPFTEMVVFPEHCVLSWDGKQDEEIPVIKRKQMFELLQKNFENSEKVLSENQVDYIFHLLADASIRMEKNQ